MKMSPEKAAALHILQSQVDKIIGNLEQMTVSLIDLGGMEDLAREFSKTLAEIRLTNERLIMRLREWQKVGMT
jgi:hypothetical protein